MPDWLLQLLIGGVIVSLIGIIYKDMLTKSEHAEICKTNSEKLVQEMKFMLNERMDNLKEFMRKDVKIAILEEMRNGRK